LTVRFFQLFFSGFFSFLGFFTHPYLYLKNLFFFFLFKKVVPATFMKGPIIKIKCKMTTFFLKKKCHEYKATRYIINQETLLYDHVVHLIKPFQTISRQKLCKRFPSLPCQQNNIQAFTQLFSGGYSRRGGSMAHHLYLVFCLFLSGHSCCHANELSTL
jgi:hypothetical protein